MNRFLLLIISVLFTYSAMGAELFTFNFTLNYQGAYRYKIKFYERGESLVVKTWRSKGPHTAYQEVVIKKKGGARKVSIAKTPRISTVLGKYQKDFLFISKDKTKQGWYSLGYPQNMLEKKWGSFSFFVEGGRVFHDSAPFYKVEAYGVRYDSHFLVSGSFPVGATGLKDY